MKHSHSFCFPRMVASSLALILVPSNLHAKNDPITVVPVIKEVSFKGDANYTLTSDDAIKTFSAPHYANYSQDDEGACDPLTRDYPTAYTRHTTPEVEMKFGIDIEIPEGKTVNVILKANGTDDVNLPAQTIALHHGQKIYTYPKVAAEKAWPDKIRFYGSSAQFTFTWKSKMEGAPDFNDCGTTKHRLYLTLGDPATELRQETLFDLGSRNADGKTTAATATTDIWNDFTDRDIRRVDGTQLTYYADYNCNNLTTESLLSKGDGQCVAWAKLFIDIRKIQGIHESVDNYVVIDSLHADGFIVKNWTFSGNGNSQLPNFPYVNIPKASYILANSYDWKYAEVNDADGVPGQGNGNPASIFNNHQVMILGEYYDPSYGVIHASISSMDDNYIDGYYSGPGSFPLDEPKVNLDLNGDGDMLDLAVSTNCLLFKKNPTGLDLKEHKSNY